MRAKTISRKKNQITLKKIKKTSVKKKKRISKSEDVENHSFPLSNNDSYDSNWEQNERYLDTNELPIGQNENSDKPKRKSFLKGLFYNWSIRLKLVFIISTIIIFSISAIIYIATYFFRNAKPGSLKPKFKKKIKDFCNSWCHWFYGNFWSCNLGSSIGDSLCKPSDSSCKYSTTS